MPEDRSATDPSGFEVTGDPTDVNVRALTPPPVVEVTPTPVAIEAPATEEMPLSQTPAQVESPTTEEVALPLRAETIDDNAATVAREKVSMPVIEPPVIEKPRVPISTAPDSLPPPVENKRAQSIGPSPACPQCEAPMAWVEEHLRFYCKSCRMYF
jgi:hypothetical protein